MGKSKNNLITGDGGLDKSIKSIVKISKNHGKYSRNEAVKMKQNLSETLDTDALPLVIQKVFAFLDKREDYTKALDLEAQLIIAKLENKKKKLNDDMDAGIETINKINEIYADMTAISMEISHIKYYPEKYASEGLIEKKNELDEDRANLVKKYPELKRESGFNLGMKIYIGVMLGLLLTASFGTYQYKKLSKQDREQQQEMIQKLSQLSYNQLQQKFLAEVQRLGVDDIEGIEDLKDLYSDVMREKIEQTTVDLNGDMTRYSKENPEEFKEYLDLFVKEDIMNELAFSYKNRVFGQYDFLEEHTNLSQLLKNIDDERKLANDMRSFVYRYGDDADKEIVEVSDEDKEEDKNSEEKEDKNFVPSLENMKSDILRRVYGHDKFNKKSKTLDAYSSQKEAIASLEKRIKTYQNSKIDNISNPYTKDYDTENADKRTELQDIHKVYSLKLDKIYLGYEGEINELKDKYTETYYSYIQRRLGKEDLYLENIPCPDTNLDEEFKNLKSRLEIDGDKLAKDYNAENDKIESVHKNNNSDILSSFDMRKLEEIAKLNSNLNSRKDKYSAISENISSKYDREYVAQESSLQKHLEISLEIFEEGEISEAAKKGLEERITSLQADHPSIDTKDIEIIFKKILEYHIYSRDLEEEKTRENLMNLVNFLTETYGGKTVDIAYPLSNYLKEDIATDEKLSEGEKSEILKDWDTWLYGY